MFPLIPIVAALASTAIGRAMTPETTTPGQMPQPTEPVQPQQSPGSMMISDLVKQKVAQMINQGGM